MLKTVLIVDDSRLARLTLRRLLAKHNLEVFEAEGVLDAEEWLKRNPLPDLIFMDIMMPHLDGYQGLARLKESSETRNIPVIMYSGDISDEARQKARDSGATGYLPKPAEGNRLDNLLDSLNRRLHEHSSEMEKAIEAEKVINDIKSEIPEAIKEALAEVDLPSLSSAPTNNAKPQAHSVPQAPVKIPAAIEALPEKVKKIEAYLQNIGVKINQLEQKDNSAINNEQIINTGRINERLNEFELRVSNIERKPSVDGNSERQQRDLILLQRQVSSLEKKSIIAIGLSVIAFIFSTIAMIWQWL